MVGTGDIVADRLGGMAAEENRARVANPLGQRISFVERQFEMLGSNPVDQRRSLFPIRYENDSAVRPPARLCDFHPWQSCQMALDRGLDRGREASIVGDEDRLRGAVVLRLRQ